MPAVPPPAAAHVIATPTVPRGPSALASSAMRHSTREAAIDAIKIRVAPLMPRAAM
ncbi:Uncharacterised protein [Mycobacterium tuberculosis]|nr:Uncharacterised protein [Mycobacterium tuberculosis]